jgi:hypothetical protein
MIYDIRRIVSLNFYQPTLGGNKMGLIWKKVKRTVLCNHLGAFGDYCSKCGAKKNQFGIGYETRWITVEEEVTEICLHFGERGDYCSKCGDRLKFGL